MTILAEKMIRDNNLSCMYGSFQLSSLSLFILIFFLIQSPEAASKAVLCCMHFYFCYSFRDGIGIIGTCMMMVIIIIQ